MEQLKQLNTHLQPSPTMPVVFVGHGNPMHAIDHNEITAAWQRVGQELPKAQAIVVMSAHWLTHGTHITAAPTQRIIYDFYGFPPELYQAGYTAQGDPAVAETLRQALARYEAQLDSSWGLDHGTWAVLRHLAPEPKVPVLQISLDVDQSLARLTELFRELRPLRERGVVFIGSGNIVHNLRLVDFTATKAADWALEFDQASAQAMTHHDLGRLARLDQLSPAARLAVPTDDHYRPMLAAMALLHPSEELRYFNNVIELGSVGMRSFVAGR